MKTAYAPKLRETFDESGLVNLRTLADTVSVSFNDVAKAVGVSAQGLRNNPTSPKGQSAGREMVDLLQRAYESIGDWKDTMIWMRSKRADLSGFSPLELILTGKSKVVEGLLHAIETGQPG